MIFTIYLESGPDMQIDTFMVDTSFGFILIRKYIWLQLIYFQKLCL